MSRIAVVGSGIAGLATAWLLSRQHEVVLFEASDYLGGHTHTHDIEFDGEHYAVDSGFIVFNEAHYPLLTAMFTELGVESQPTTMSFSVHDEGSGLETTPAACADCSASPATCGAPCSGGCWPTCGASTGRAPPYCPRILRPRRWASTWHRTGIGHVPRQSHHSMARRCGRRPRRHPRLSHDHLVAFWPTTTCCNCGPAAMGVVRGGSQCMCARCARGGRAGAAATPVTSYARERRCSVTSRLATILRRVVLACHADDALALLVDATTRERESWARSATRTTSHPASDIRVLPNRRGAWAAWKAWVLRTRTRPVVSATG